MYLEYRMKEKISFTKAMITITKKILCNKVNMQKQNLYKENAEILLKDTKGDLHKQKDRDFWLEDSTS